MGPILSRERAEAFGILSHRIDAALDDLIERHGFAEPDIVKMDVEGAEAAVLAGARAVLERRKTNWFIALHGDEQKAAGYRVFDLDGRLLTDDLRRLPLDEICAVAWTH